ncbi:RHS repeat-associated core domain-containing protein [Streptomyces sp. NPDC052701]|uniref:RHS repeat-associated core domain-containing protein n=1 Tax=Streptomyces sp. NPDC052701 TaxID=3155533 RepID=UPI00343A94F6
MTTGGEVPLLPHRRHGQRPRPGRRRGQAHPHTYAYGPTGLYKMGHRSYDPHPGRFTQPDPSGQETNACLYAGGDPINNTDPPGLGFGNFVDGVFGGKDLHETWQNRNDPDALIAQSVGMVAGAVFGAACVAGTSTMATAAGMPYLIPLATAGCGIAAGTVSNVTAGAMEDTLK